MHHTHSFHCQIITLAHGRRPPRPQLARLPILPHRRRCRRLHTRHVSTQRQTVTLFHSSLHIVSMHNAGINWGTYQDATCNVNQPPFACARPSMSTDFFLFFFRSNVAHSTASAAFVVATAAVRVASVTVFYLTRVQRARQQPRTCTPWCSG